jgi:hypothetical protein
MMSNEEWDRKVEFLLSQQAKFEVDLAETNKTLAQVSERLAEQSYIMAEGFKIARTELDEIREAQQLTGSQIQELKESQKLTDEQLQKFIAKVDRLTGETQNGSLN